jgi:hypothetical protein
MVKRQANHGEGRRSDDADQGQRCAAQPDSQVVSKKTWHRYVHRPPGGSSQREAGKTPISIRRFV